MGKTEYTSYPSPLIDHSASRTLNLDGSFILPAQLNVKKGTVIYEGGDAMYKSGKVYLAVTAGTTVQLYKDHSFGVGDPMFDGATERTIASIDTSNELYDSIVVDDVLTYTLNEVIYSTNAGAVNTTGLSVVTSDVIFENASSVVAVAVCDQAILNLDQMPYFWGAAIATDQIKTL